MSGTAPSRAVASGRARGWLWLQLGIGWTPVWVFYATLMYTMHGGAFGRALFISGRAIGIAALLGMLVLRFTERVPWPKPVRPAFVLLHVGAALTYATTWVALATVLEGLLHGAFRVVTPPGVIPFIAVGVWLYIAVAGVSYAVLASERAARAEAAAVRAQLAALRGQLNPHFLFNALHTVVQLIPVSPERAADATERLAGLLRTAAREDRDLVPLGEELAFVERYLDLERLRFGDRLDVSIESAPALAPARVPAFALQTLVENAVRHGAAPRAEPTRIAVASRSEGGALVLEVADTGAGADPAAVQSASGTGLRRLRERLDALFGSRASFRVETRPGDGFRATMTIPLIVAEDEA